MLREFINRYLLTVIIGLFAAGYFTKFFIDWIQIREFVEAGPRNTAEQGFNLCERIGRLETAFGIESPDCEEIYRTD